MGLVVVDVICKMLQIFTWCSCTVTFGQYQQFSEMFVFAQSGGFMGCKVEDSVCSSQPCHEVTSIAESCR